MGSLSRRRLALCAGAAVPAAAPLTTAMALTVAGGLFLSEASAQTTYQWAAPVNGLWTNQAAWTPGGAPQSDDNAVLGLSGAYTVTLDVNRSIDDLTITNPSALLSIAPNASLSLDGSIMSVGTVRLDGSDTLGASALTLDPDEAATGTILLIAETTLSRAALRGPASGNPAILGTSAVVTGRGILDNLLINNGLVFADGTGAEIQLSTSGDFVQGVTGELRARDGGRLLLQGETIIGGTLDVSGGGLITPSSATLRDVTIVGTPIIDPNQTLRLDTGTDLPDGVVLNGSDALGNAALNLLASVELDGVITLNAVGALNRADLNGPGSGTPAVIAQTAVISGRGRLDNLLFNNGLVVVDTPGEVIELSTSGDFNQGPTGVLRATHGGRLLLLGETIVGGTLDVSGGGLITPASATLRDVTIVGTPIIDPNQTLRLDTGTPLPDGIVLNGSDKNGSAALNVLAPVELDGPITLNAEGALNRADLNGPSSGDPAVIAETAVVSGRGRLDNLLSNNGLVIVDGPDEVIELSTSGDFNQGPTGVLRATNGGRLLLLGETIIGGTLDVSGGGLITPASALLQNVTVVGTPIIDPNQTLRLGTGTPLNDGITLNGSDTLGASTLRLQAPVSLGGPITMNLDGTTLSRVSLRGPSSGDPAVLDETAVLTGEGTLDDLIEPIAGVVRPGTAFNPGTMVFSLSGGTSFTDTTELQIGFAGVNPGQFGQIQNSGSLVLDGTLRVNALGGFAPLSTNEIEIITGGTITGRFDTVEYDGNLEEGDVARAFYEPNRVVFAVTCNADVTLPAGILNIIDVLAFINTWNTQGPGADFNEDGSIDIVDVVNFIQLWNNGCPE